MTRDQALALKGHDILIPTDSLPELPEGEFYHFQLQGLQVKDINGHDYGRVEEIMQTGANDVLVTKGTTTSLVPYIPDVIQQVDLESGIIYVQWQTEI